MNDSLVESTPTFRLCSDPNPRLGFYLLGFPKPVRFEPKHYTRTIPLRFPRSKRESIGGTPIGRAFPAKTATEEPHQVVSEPHHMMRASSVERCQTLVLAAEMVNER